MACEFQIFLNAGQYARGAEIAMCCLDLVDQLEDQLTVYRSHSEISQINERAFAGSVEVEPRLFALLQLAVKLWRETDAAYDITSGPLSKLWGFTRRAGAIPASADLAAALAKIGSQHLAFDDERHTLGFLEQEVELNLGSIGKGYALDRCAELLHEHEIGDFLLHGGHSSVLGFGSHGATPGEGWLVGMRNPLRPSKRLGEVRLGDGALATSGSGTQFFVHEGTRYGHILDPRSGWPAQGVLSSTVLAPTAALADALSTAFYVLGPEGAERYCHSHPEIGAILLSPNTSAAHGSPVIHTFGIVQEQTADDYYVWTNKPDEQASSG